VGKRGPYFGADMEKPKIRLIVGWRSREARVREIRQRMRAPPIVTPLLARIPLLKRKP